MARTPRASIQFVELYTQKNQEKLVALAKQEGGFRIALDKELQRTVGRTSKSIATKTLEEGVRGIRDRMRKGISGARSSVSKNDLKNKNSNDSSYVAVTISFRGLYLGDVSYSTSFQQLSKWTVWRKRNHDGKGKFWKDYGSAGQDSRGRPTIESLAETLKPPKVTSRAFEESLDSRRANKKDPMRIDFSVELSFGNMNFPFDELVRRPLITGNVDSGRSSASKGRSSDKESVLFHLEYGTKGGRTESGKATPPVPARPWIRYVSGQVGDNLFDNILNQ